MATEAMPQPKALGEGLQGVYALGVAVGKERIGVVTLSVGFLAWQEVFKRKPEIPRD